MKKNYLVVLLVGAAVGLYAMQTDRRAPETASWFWWGAAKKPAAQQMPKALPLSMDIYIRNYAKAKTHVVNNFLRNVTSEQIDVLNKLDDAMRKGANVKLSDQEAGIFHRMPKFVQRLFIPKAKEKGQ